MIPRLSVLNSLYSRGLRPSEIRMIILRFIKPEEIDLVNIETPLTGHIDLIQERFGKLYVMDYKTNLNRPKSHASQLLLYKEALHQRTSIPKNKIIPAVFNEHDYYEYS